MPDLRVMLGLRLEELRNWAHMTREELAQRTDLDPRQLADYELYGVWPEPENLTRLSAGLDVVVHELFNFTETRVRSLLPLEQRLAKRTARSKKA
jgi:transcriptional regulator with XRE-family HTH domain